MCSAPFLLSAAGETGGGSRTMFPFTEGLRQCRHSQDCKKRVSTLGTTDYLKPGEIQVPQTLESFGQF